MRHFAIANLYRLRSIQERVLAWIEANVPQMVRRIVGPPPAGVRHTLRDFVDIFFDLEVAHHDRPHGRKSQRHMDLLELCTMANGDLLNGEWTHYCHDPSTGKPCCRNQSGAAERAVVATVNALLGECDPIPAESMWAHLLSNMKRTLLRRVLFRVGVDCFDVPSAGGVSATGPVDADRQASDAYMRAVHQSRISKTTAYYKNERDMHELVVYATILEACDAKLLCPMMGDPVRPLGAPTKLDLLHDRTSTLIGACLQDMLHLMRTW